MPKTATFTTITPLPAGITKKSVLEMYQDHLAMIDLNPLVVERFKCRPPAYAPADEYFTTAWYTIKDKVSYLPGGLATGSVSYHACFDDMPDGLETHVYAPLGLDIRGKWSVGGSFVGEAPRPLEKGLKIPRHGLYIREDVRMTCSTFLMGFVKRTFKDSHSALVEKLVERAHILESNFANQRLQQLRNVDPGERMAIGDIFIAPPPDYRPNSYTPPPNRTPFQGAPLSLFPNCTPTPDVSLQRSRSRTDAQPIVNNTLLHTQPTHSRSYSDPITSPSFSSATTLVFELDKPFVPPKDDRDEHYSPPSPPPVPEQSLYLLPATTYNVNRSSEEHHPIFLHPGNHHRQGSNVSVEPPRVSYPPGGRPITFTFPNDSRFDRTSQTEISHSDPNHNLLDEIDDAIDQVFLFTVPTRSPANEKFEFPSHSSSQQSSLYSPTSSIDEILPATTYSPEPMLPSTKYEPKRQPLRKDSIIPYNIHDKALPPVPIDQD
ncbi:hypothetical protein GQ44DRAFT_775681 [Phaeosphaeriaceae sp. PMI808]|nr:hypothetical protein GQ44DRAFT_775681 [Phaeosphaeriaceae sp. PMI808]